MRECRHDLGRAIGRRRRIELHPAALPAARGGGEDWLDPHLSWTERWHTLDTQRRPDREDWYYRWMLAARRR
jgi:hypothetical protein